MPSTKEPPVPSDSGLSFEKMFQQAESLPEEEAVAPRPRVKRKRPVLETIPEPVVEAPPVELTPEEPNHSDGSTQILQKGRKKKFAIPSEFGEAETPDEEPEALDASSAVAQKEHAISAAVEALSSVIVPAPSILDDVPDENASSVLSESSAILPEESAVLQLPPPPPPPPPIKKRVVQTKPVEKGASSAWLSGLFLSYAVTVTIGFLYLLNKVLTTPPSDLESLPDIPPLVEKKLTYYKKEFLVPTGHTLALGSKQRFGNVIVEPLRVTRGPLEFHHHVDSTRVRPAEREVLKLWVRLTNASKNQTFAPLDRQLVDLRKKLDTVTLANQYVFPRSQKKSPESPVLLFDLPPDSEWECLGQELGQILAPGASAVTYLPTAREGVETLTGELVWRVHLRKGFSARGNGVTTLFEVVFRDSEIESDNLAAK